MPIKETLIRLKGNCCFYRGAPAPTGKRGAPRKHGDKLQHNYETTHANPDGHWESPEALPIQISWWQQLHLKDAEWLPLTVIRVVRPFASNKERDPQVSWFVWIGDQQADMAQMALASIHRFSQEHGYRFDKQCLLWDKPQVRAPERFERWSLIVAFVHNLFCWFWHVGW